MGVKVWLGSIFASEHHAAPESIDVVFSFAGKTARKISDFCCSAKEIPSELHPNFRLFYVSPQGWTHLYSDDEVPETDLDGTFVLKKSTVRADQESKLLRCESALSILFAELATTIDADDLGASPSQMDKLDEYADPNFTVQRQYVEVVQSLPRYATIPLWKCTVLPERPGDAPLSSVGLRPGRDTTWQLSFEGIHLTQDDKNLLFELPRIRCWSIPMVVKEIQNSIRNGVCGTFSFEYFSKAKVFMWIHISTPEAASVGQQLQRIVPFLYKDQQGAQWPDHLKSETAGKEPKRREQRNFMFGF